MSEVQSRPAQRGRSSGRGGRGGSSFGGRGGAQSLRSRANGAVEFFEKPAKSNKINDDDNVLVELRKKYSNELNQLKELFPDWSDADLLYAIDENQGDVENTATHIAEGM